ncbi:hypothetical protein DPEC_G00348350 [Dallia pectoralis]|uniref:Uncharacterized protein n=1 Tax=Dallia pectoralis TaxID=75939 RepID=A0ACC2F495_DALPE|nr:hypothetical protein DPEC_G00348350 [Dallia pectoralis]
MKFKEDQKHEAPKHAKAKEEVAEENDGQTGVLTQIITNALARSLPQPAGSPWLRKANTEARQQYLVIECSNNQKVNRQTTGVLGWIAHGLASVVPHPDTKCIEGDEPEAITEVHVIHYNQDAESVVSEEEPEEEKGIPPRVIEWIKQGFEKVVPQPADIITDCTLEDLCAQKVPSLPPEAKEEAKTSVVAWIVHGFGLILPQPVLTPGEPVSG